MEGFFVLRVFSALLCGRAYTRRGSIHNFTVHHLMLSGKYV